MITFDDFINENKTNYNLKYILEIYNPYRLLIIGGSGSKKTNAPLNLIKNQQDIDKIYLYAKDQYKAKYQYLINKRQKTDLKHFDDSKVFINKLNSIHFFIIEIPNKTERQQYALNHSSDIDFKDFMKIYKKCIIEPYHF